MGFPLLRDQADLEFPDRYAAVRSVEMGVHPFTGLRVRGPVGSPFKRPDSGKRCIQVLDQELRAIREDLWKGVIPGKRNADVRHQSGEAHALGEGCF